MADNEKKAEIYDDEEEETDPEKLKLLMKQRLKEEKKRQAIKDEEERKLNLRKALLTKEINYYESMKDQIKETTTLTTEALKGPQLQIKKEHFWGTFRLKNEWKEFHCYQLLEDVKGRLLGEDFVYHVYLECFEQIMGSFQEIMLQMMNDFELQRDRMLKNHWAFLKYAKLKGMEFRDDVRAVSYGISDRYESKCQMLSKKQKKHRLKQHDKHLGLIAETAYDLETKAFNLWVQFRTVLGRFRKDWKIARRFVLFLKLKYADDRKVIAKQKIAIKEMEVKNKRDDDSNELSFWNIKNNELAEERTDYANSYGLFQHTFKNNIKFDENKLTHMSKVSLAIIKELERIKEKIEKVLHAKQVCFKLETQEEKVFPSEYVETFNHSPGQDFDSALCIDKLTYRTAVIQSHCDYMEIKLKEEVKINKDLKCKLRYVLSQLRPDRDIDITMTHY